MPDQKTGIEVLVSAHPRTESDSVDLAQEKLIKLAEELANFSSEQGVEAVLQPRERVVGSPRTGYDRAIKAFEAKERSNIALNARSRPAEIQSDKMSGGSRVELETVKRLQEAGVVVAWTDNSDLVLMPAPMGYDFKEMARRLTGREDSRLSPAVTDKGLRKVKPNPVNVPKPKSARHPERPMPAHLKAQVNHLHEAEKKLPFQFRTETFVSGIRTEAEAAQYIREVTEAIQAAHQEANAERSRNTSL